ncbi:preprotein translocase subunit SecE [Oceanotoga sp. DSM 15011]|uniref:Protein translocase subunit SecE n=1 Tax=Oceanotoga teriensis TaxID=515440 RepID=A0AA45C620_9BACT|nr:MULTISPECIES: preprotein translocase subunit SecE [Oceanotoga]MDN5341775.1 preprotein translocase subunit SecE [Oceanotoga sp.]MDO7975687.1 preprotein translocase subunit SecE [Oceanotoga teriensis]PWJ90564.1 protein translocase subunit secE/sec61 gamma [Oceanotoga teriensis]UYO99809.1 preprotein translocase subunit SecE [Oceanotoga sp. DSM 15011]
MSKFWVFLSSVWQEAKKVSWPSKKDLMKSTGVVLVIILFVSVYLLVIDWGLLSAFTKWVYPIFLGGMATNMTPNP